MLLVGIRLFLSIVSVLLLVVAPAPARSESLALLSINDDESLGWKLVEPDSGVSSTVSNSFGEQGNHILLGSLTSAKNGPQLGVLVDNGSNAVTWRVMNQSGELIKELSFGSRDDTFISGADFDHNGIIDPVAIERIGKRLHWDVRLNGLTAKSEILDSFQFGKKSSLSKLFYADLFGEGDWIGLVKKSRKQASFLVQLRNVRDGAQRRFSLKRLKRVSERPVPVMSSDGVDLLAITRTSNSRVRAIFVDATGKIVARHRFRGSGTIVAGDFDPGTPGEELAVQSDNTLLLYNPQSNTDREVSIPSGIIVDSININSFVEMKNGSGGSGSGSGKVQCSGGTPGICGCSFLDETDGYKSGFIYKRKSDTYGGIVVVLPNPCGSAATGLNTLDSDCNKIHSLYDNGYANPDSTGDRRHFKETDGRYTGQWYKQNHGSIVLQLVGTNACFMIDNPAEERID